MSIAGGMDKAIERGEAVGCTAIQVFTKSSNQWQAKPLGNEELARYRARRQSSPIRVVFGHNSYLINLASPDAALREKSRQAMIVEVERATALGMPFLVMHPGAHGGAGEAAGIERIATSLKEIIAATRESPVRLALETTAGQGNSVGCRFEHLADILSQVGNEARLGVCFDTCHVYAAGYDIASEKGYDQTWKEFEAIVGLRPLLGFHLNDSKKPLASKVDRHEQIGKGTLGLTPFKRLLNDRRFAQLPMSLETPKSEDGHEDRENLNLLRSLIHSR